MTTTIEELAKLVAEQGRRISALEAAGPAKSAATANPAVDLRVASLNTSAEGVRIVNAIERCPIAIPTDAEHRRILAAVLRVYPRFKPESNSRWAEQDAEDFFQQYCVAFERIAHLRRIDKPDERRYVSFWASDAEDWYRARGKPTTVGVAAFLAAAIGAGDLNFICGDAHGNSWTLGLATFSGRPATEAWRRVLEGKLLSPLPGRFAASVRGPSVQFAGE
jgi:hypothetical protein